MRPAVFEDGGDQAQLPGGAALFLVAGVAHFAQIIAVGQSEVAFTGGDGAHLGAIVSGGLAGEVLAQAAEPVFGPVCAAVGDHGGEEGDIVGVLPIAQADFAAPFWIGEGFIGGAA